jgi:hypothetical protein
VASEGARLVGEEWASVLRLPLRVLPAPQLHPSGGLDASLLVVEMEPGDGPGGFFRGSPTLRVVRDAPCPVLVVPAA